MKVVTRVYSTKRADRYEQEQGVRILATVFEKREGQPNRFIETIVAPKNQ